MSTTENEILVGNDYNFSFSDKEDYAFKAQRGLTREIVAQISEMKNEPEWMREFRLKSYDYFVKRPMPTWGGGGALERDRLQQHLLLHQASREAGQDLGGYPVLHQGYLREDRYPRGGAQATSPASARSTRAKSSITRCARTCRRRASSSRDTDTALREYPELMKQYFGTIIPPNDNKFAALNSAVWSGGSFVYVPEGVHIDVPLQAYFRINAENMGQFERTLIICAPGSYVHYVEGCTAPTYGSESLHSAVVEIIVQEGARCRYTTIQNWSKNVFNLVTKRAAAYKDATMEWVDGNLGSRLTMKYPAVWLMEPGAKGEVLSIAYATDGQHQDAGAKMVHVAGNTSSTVTSKSISKGAGRSSYRGLVKVHPGATNVKSSVVCDALLLDEHSRTDTYPYMEIEEDNVTIGHEASVSKVGEEQLFYLQSRGLSEAEAMSMIVSGFIEPIAKELPLEYAVELNRLIQLEMIGSVG